MTKIKCKKCNAWLFSAGGSINIEIPCKSCKCMNRIKTDDVAGWMKNRENNGYRVKARIV